MLLVEYYKICLILNILCEWWHQ